MEFLTVVDFFFHYFSSNWKLTAKKDFKKQVF